MIGRKRKDPVVHLYGGLSRQGAILTLCGKAKFQLPAHDTVVMHYRGERDLCPDCRRELDL